MRSIGIGSLAGDPFSTSSFQAAGIVWTRVTFTEPSTPCLGRSDCVLAFEGQQQAAGDWERQPQTFGTSRGTGASGTGACEGGPGIREYELVDTGKTGV